MAASSGSRRAIYAALAGNLLIAITKFGAAAWTGSSAMLSEGMHSLVDTSNELLLLYGLHRSERAPDIGHPFGHGRELYFWSLIVALLIFGVGAGVSFYEGIRHVLAPSPVEDAVVSYAVLGLSALFEGYSWSVAFKEFRARKGSSGYIEAIRRSKDPTTFTVLLEDSAALAGIAIAGAGIAAAEHWGIPALDGAASIGIGLVLALTAVFLARETKSLLIGEHASTRLQAAVLQAAAADPAVQHANGVITVQLGPAQVVAALSAEFKDSATAPDIEACVERVERSVKGACPEVTILLVKPQTASRWREFETGLKAAG